MQTRVSFKHTLALFFLLFAFPILANAQTTHVVQVLEFRFEPQDITIQAGDTVRWENPPNPGGVYHNLVGEQGAFQYQVGGTSWMFEHTFTEGGTFPYYCTPHRFDGMVGSVTVEGSVVVEPTFEIDPGLNGNWWSGSERDGEGAQVEVADAGGGDLVFVVTIYSYAPQGGQMFLIGVGTPDGDSVELELFITSGGAWGDDFDPDDTPQTSWGTGMAAAGGCDQLSITLTPNAEYLGMGYTEFTLDLERLTTSLVACPYE
jgi:plastocyanin